MNQKLLTVVTLVLLFSSSLFAQAKDSKVKAEPAKSGKTQTTTSKVETSDNIVMLEEILIQVSPELPTVVVTIPRQKPEIKPVSIQNPIERMVSKEKEVIIPDLTKMKVSKVEEPEKMLAQQRIR